MKSPLVSKIYEAYSKDQKSYKIPREDKINSFREEKAAKEELKEITVVKDRVSRQIYIAQYDCVNLMLFFPMEREMLAMRERLQNDPTLKQNYLQNREKLRKKKPEFKFIRINTDGTKGRVISEGFHNLNILSFHV